MNYDDIEGTFGEVKIIIFYIYPPCICRCKILTGFVGVDMERDEEKFVFCD